MEKSRVLLADDYVPFRKALREILLSQPELELVGEAESGQDALDKARSLRPDIVLVDITLPDINGLDVAGLIKQCLPEADIIVLTDDSDEEYRTAVAGSGASGLLAKGSARKELLPMMRGIHRARSE
ncbi:MAG: response regulator transcription factor [Chloroflexi bacterium]|nr:response regulator transcription factor [Chloroflexota bacterium]